MRRERVRQVGNRERHMPLLQTSEEADLRARGPEVV